MTNECRRLAWILALPLALGCAAKTPPQPRALDSRMSVHWIELPLKDCVENIAADADLQFVLDRRLDGDSPINLRLENVPRDLIVQIVANLGELQWTTNGRVVILGKADAVARFDKLRARHADWQKTTTANVLKQKVSVEFIDLPLHEGLAELERQVQFPLLIDPADFELAHEIAHRPITFQLRGEPLDVTLTALAAMENFNWRVDESATIMLTRERTKANSPRSTSTSTPRCCRPRRRRSQVRWYPTAGNAAAQSVPSVWPPPIRQVA